MSVWHGLLREARAATPIEPTKAQKWISYVSGGTPESRAQWRESKKIPTKEYFEVMRYLIDEAERNLDNPDQAIHFIKIHRSVLNRYESTFQEKEESIG